MTSQELRVCIDRMNRNGGKDSIFPRRISSNVWVARVWSTSRRPSKGYEGIIFFVTDDQGEYVAAIQDRESDLHWYVVPIHRGKGHLTKALQEAILPYLFENGREIQRITIDEEVIGKKRYNDSKSVAIRLGFMPVDKWGNVFELRSADFDMSHTRLDLIRPILSQERINELGQKLDHMQALLERISDELYMVHDDDLGAKQIALMVSRLKSALR